MQQTKDLSNLFPSKSILENEFIKNQRKINVIFCNATCRSSNVHYSDCILVSKTFDYWACLATCIAWLICYCITPCEIAGILRSNFFKVVDGWIRQPTFGVQACILYSLLTGILVSEAASIHQITASIAGWNSFIFWLVSSFHEGEGEGEGEGGKYIKNMH
jgi:hypothetical protein